MTRSPNVLWHVDTAPGIAGVEAATLDLRSAFPDLTVTADEIVAAGDRVAILWTMRGTHRGEFLGIEATGNQVSTSGTDIYRIADGRIAEIWTVGDDLSVLFQLEAFPAANGSQTSPLAAGEGETVTETTEAMASTQSEIRALLDRWSDAIWHKDIDRLLTLYAPDSVYFDVVPPLQHKGTDAIRRNFLRWFAGWTSGIGQDVHDVTIWTSGGIAVASMLIRASGTLTDGREVGYWVRATVGCQRSGQEWLIVHEHVSLPVDFARGRAAMDLEP